MRVKISNAPKKLATTKKLATRVAIKTKIVFNQAKRAKPSLSAIKHAKPQAKIVQKPIIKAISKTKSDQNKQIRPVVRPKTKAIKKNKKVQKKQTLRVLSDKQILREQKKQERLERMQKKQHEKLQKMVKAKLLDLNPNEKVPNLKVNTLIEQAIIPQAKKQTQRTFELRGCCIFCNNREVLQCIKYNDVPGFKKCLSDVDSISNPFQNFCLSNKNTVIKEVIKQQNVEMLKLIIDYQTQLEKGKVKRVKLPILNLQKTTTGVANRHQFYFPIRQVKLSRGGKEGNNAFTHDNSMRKISGDSLFSDILKFSPSLKIIQLIQTQDKDFLDVDGLKNQLGQIARSGNYPLLCYVFQKIIKNQGFGFNKLHQAAIFQGEEVNTIKNVNKTNLMKKDYGALQLMPGHYAAINPDPSIFKKFFKAYPSTLIQDAQMRDISHYAAANQNSDVLAFLIARKQNINNRDSSGTTPLMIACKLGRTENVKLLMEEQQRQLNGLDESDEDYQHYLSHYKYVNQTGSYKNTPIHIAAKNGFLNIVKILVEEGQSELEPKNFYGNTPLGEAAEKGHLSIVEYLLEKGANIHGKDKQMKTPIIRACINGHIHVVAFLLRKGVNPNFKDASDNTILHYACAYGWLNIVKLLIQSGSDPNLLTEWKSSCILIAMLKGHFGIVDFLINLPQINASFQDDEGRTLLAQLCMNINEDSAKNLKYLLDKKKIDVSIKDQNGFTPLHHLACNDIKSIVDDAVRNQDEKKQETSIFYRKGKKIKRKQWNHNGYGQTDRFIGYFKEDKDKNEYKKRLNELNNTIIKCAGLLQKEGLELGELTEEKEMTPLFIAMDNNNFYFADWLFSQEPQAIQGKSEKGENILHLISKNIYNQELYLLPQFVNINPEKLKQLALEEDNNGYTPFLLQFKKLVGIQDTIFDNYQYTEDFKQYFKTDIIPKVFLNMIKNAKIYAYDLDYDISSYIGMTKPQKEKLEGLKEQAMISDEEYTLLKSLQYDVYVNQKQQQEKDRSEPFKFDNIKKFDPKKQNLGLITDITGEVKKNDEERNNQRNIKNFYRRRKSMTGRKVKKPAFILGNKSSLIEDKYEINVQDFYSEVNCKKTCLHLLLEFFQNENKVENKDALNLVKEILKLSLKFKNKEQNQYYQGFNKFDKTYKNILFQAIQNEQKDFIIEIFDSQAINLNLQSTSKKLGLFHYLSKVKHQQIIDNLIKHKLDLDMRDKNLNTPLHYAAYLRNDYLVEKLLSQGAEVNAISKHGYNALHFSLISFDDSLDHTPKIERMLIEKGINLNLIDNDGRTPVFYLFFKNTNEIKKQDPANMVMALLQTKQIKVNIQDRNLNTPLHYACQKGSTISALSLMNYGSDFKLTNILGNNPFAEALQYKQADLCVFLIQQGCNYNDTVKDAQLQEKSDDFQALIQKVIPSDFYDEVISKQKSYLSYEDYLKQNYSIKEQSPFYLALKQNQGGIGYLLLSKQYDIYDAMVSCLKSCKLEKFVDLFDSVSKQRIIHQNDKHNRSLLFNLVISVAKGIDNEAKNNNSDEDENENEDEDDDEENKDKGKNQNLSDRCVDICQMLINQYQFDISASDSKNSNIFHKLAQRSSSQEVFELFEKILKIVPKPKAQAMLVQKDSQRNAIPFVYLFTEKFLKVQKFDILNYVDFKNIDQTYHSVIQDPNADKKYDLPEYLDDSIQFPFYKEGKGRICSISHKIIKKLDNIEKQDQEKIIKSLITNGVRFNLQTSDQGLTDLMLAVLHQKFEIVQILLGYVFDDKLLTYKQKGKPLVQINDQDFNGKTALHYSLRPSKYGSWMNYKIFNSLLQTKADPQIVDKEGMNVLDYAIDQPVAYKIIMKQYPKIMPKKNKVPNFEKEQIGKKKQNGYHKMQIDQNEKKFEYQDDAELYLQEVIKNAKLKTKKKEDKKVKDVQVDEISKLDQRCDVFRPDVDSLYYDSLLTKIDVKKYFYGICNFYILQLLFDKVKNIFILWTRWGRIGDQGQYQRTPFNTKEEAEKEFMKVFKQKTGVNWNEVRNHQPVAGKYKVKRVGGKFIFQEQDGVHWKESEREIDVKDLVLDFETKQFRKLKAYGINKTFMIQSILEQSTIKRIKEILNQIYSLCKDEQKFKQDKNFEQYEKCLEMIGDLSNLYFEATMPIQFAGQGTNSLYNVNSVRQELAKIDQIYDFEQVVKMLFAAMYRINEINPYEYIYNSLNSNLKQLDSSAEEYQLLIKYINQSNSKVKQNHGSINGQQVVLKSIFKVESLNHNNHNIVQEDRDTQFSSLHNHFLLFHGTSNANVLSIIEQGLQIFPKHSSSYHGNAFGDGIYFADQYNLAVQYSDANQGDSNKDNDFCVLVCEVALGNICNAIQVNYFEKMPEHYNSLRMMSSKGPSFDMNLVRSDGCIWPLGPIVKYERSSYKYKEKTYYQISEIKDSQKLKTKQKKKSPSKKEPKNMIRRGKKKQQESDDENMSDSENSQEENESEGEMKDEDLEFKENIQNHEKKYLVEPHLVSISNFTNTKYEQNYYQLNEAQYIVNNSNQVRVKYILHLRKLALEGTNGDDDE